MAVLIRNFLPIAVLLAAILGWASAQASSIEVAGRAYQPYCTYYTGSVGDFKIAYHNQDLGSDSTVNLVYGFYDDFQSKPWTRQATVAMRKVGPGHWAIELMDLPIDSRGSYYLSEMEFVFQLQKSTGEVYYDNGGKAPLGFYLTAIPQRSCGKPEQFQMLSVDSR